MAFENVIFDLDGTLVDSLPGIEYSVDFALRQEGYPARTCGVQPLIGPPIRNMLQVISGETLPAALDGLEAAFRRSYDTEGWKKTVLQTEASETLAWLGASGRSLFIVTNKPRQATLRIVEHFGLAGFFTSILSPDSGAEKYNSKAEMIQRLMQAESVSVANSLFVGDTREDVEAAAVAKMPVAILVTGYGAMGCQAAATVHHRIQTLSELRSIIRNAGGPA